MEHTIIAVDLAKSVFQVAVSHRVGQVTSEHRLRRSQMMPFFAQQPAATVLLEACGSAHHWAREVRRLGHTPRLLPAHDVHRYVRRNKTDRADAKALLEAHRNDEIHAVPVKSIEQQAIASLHVIRATWLSTKTARLNALRGLCREFGITIPVGAARVIPAVRAQLTPDGPLPPLLMPALEALCAEITTLKAGMAEIEQQLAALAEQMPDVIRLQTIPGIGLLTASALVARIGDAARFPDGRHFASALGLTAKEDSSGLHRRLGGISKRGDVYLRQLLIHGARAVLGHAKRHREPDPLRAWALRTQDRRGHNVAAVALANKLARIVWAVWTRGCDYAAATPRPQTA
jgi:transposase